MQAGPGPAEAGAEHLEDLTAKSQEEKMAQYNTALKEYKVAIHTLKKTYVSGAALMKSLQEKGFSVTELLHEDEEAQDLSVQVSKL